LKSLYNFALFIRLRKLYIALTMAKKMVDRAFEIGK